MVDGRRKEVVRHLTEAELADRLRAADDPRLVRRLGFVMNCYRGDTIAEAAAREGKSQPTGVRWADRWNEGGLEALAPDPRTGRPPKLDAADRDRLQALLDADPPWTTGEIRRLLDAEFGVAYHPNYLYELLRSFDVEYADAGGPAGERRDDAGTHREE